MQTTPDMGQMGGGEMGGTSSLDAKFAVLKILIVLKNFSKNASSHDYISKGPSDFGANDILPSNDPENLAV